MTGEPVCPLCRSRFCLVRSADVCLTLHRPRKGPEAPPMDRMVRAAAVKK